MAIERPLPSAAEVESWIRERRNWGRWGADDETGAINLVTSAKRVDAARLVRSGRSVSLSRPFPKTPGPGNPTPAQHWMRRMERPNGSGACGDFQGVFFHGYACTHIDALCHVWDGGGMWNGRDPDQEIGFDGARWGAIDRWSDGIVTRGVLLDVPRHRGDAYVKQERPVHGRELEEIAAAQGVELRPGDAVAVYSGREAWDRENPVWGSDAERRPGLHPSCLPFLREHDIAVLVWDMMDLLPNGYGLAWGVHPAIFSYGVALVDNALLEPLAAACAEEERYEFMLVLAPLVVSGGTGSPLNPLALF
jgi:kynurenine formamidase